jgi:hypothetical protein
MLYSAPATHYVMNRTMTHFFVKQVKQTKKPDDLSG